MPTRCPAGRARDGGDFGAGIVSGSKSSFHLSRSNTGSTAPPPSFLCSPATPRLAVLGTQLHRSDLDPATPRAVFGAAEAAEIRKRVSPKPAVPLKTPLELIRNRQIVSDLELRQHVENIALCVLILTPRSRHDHKSTLFSRFDQILYSPLTSYLNLIRPWACPTYPCKPLNHPIPRRGTRA